MGKPAARITDFHMCPMVTPGLSPIRYLGWCIVGPCMPKALISGKPENRIGDTTAHGGVIMLGCFPVMVGDDKASEKDLSAEFVNMI